MQTLHLTFAVLVILSCAGTAVAADVIVFPAENGKVIFSHKKHQETIKDCSVCHTSTPGKMRDPGQFRPHQLCIGCHEQKKSGPVNCADCHKPS